ncbi:MAG: DUF362 domain-containing protein [Desulfobacterales bacterium]
MKKSVVAVVTYEQPVASVRKAVELANGPSMFKSGARVFIKPNIVFWNKHYPIPKYGAITTSRVVEDTINLLKECGIDDITVGEGTVINKPKVKGLQEHAFETLGYNALKKKYGIKTMNVFERPFKKVDLGEGMTLNFSEDILNADLIVDIPALKTHGQTTVSLGLKNLKGTIDIASRKKCHSTDPVKDLNYWVSRIYEPMPPIFTIIDGIYSLELGPGFEGRARRSNLLIASTDVLSADMAGAKALGFEPNQVPHLVHAAEKRNRPMDFSDVDILGEPLDTVSSPHRIEYDYTNNGELPAYLAKYGVEGISWRNPGSTMCTYCTGFTSPVLTNIVSNWKGKAFDDVEVLTGKDLKPTPGKKKTVLLGKCIYQANKDDPDIQEMYAEKGCPPSEKGIIRALQQAGIPVDDNLFEIYDSTIMPILSRRYTRKPEEFQESFFTIQENTP